MLAAAASLRALDVWLDRPRAQVVGPVVENCFAAAHLLLWMPRPVERPPEDAPEEQLDHYDPPSVAVTVHARLQHLALPLRFV